MSRSNQLAVAGEQRRFASAHPVDPKALEAYLKGVTAVQLPSNLGQCLPCTLVMHVEVREITRSLRSCPGR